MKIATFNVNGVNGRLPVLLRWLEEAAPDVVCLQELKAAQERFPEAAIRAAGYGAIWHGQKGWNGVAILARGVEPHETRRGLPGDPDDAHSRYIEAAVNGVLVGCLYLPNGNPAPGLKFDYKLRWFERLTAHAADLFATGAHVVLAGDYNVMPTDLEFYKPERWLDDALFRPEVREAYRRLVAQGWTDALRMLHPGERIYTFWDHFRNAYGRDAGLKTAEVDRQVSGWEKASDHAPTWIELADTAKRSKARASPPVAAPRWRRGKALPRGLRLSSSAHPHSDCSFIPGASISSSAALSSALALLQDPAEACLPSRINPQSLRSRPSSQPSPHSPADRSAVLAECYRLAAKHAKPDTPKRRDSLV